MSDKTSGGIGFFRLLTILFIGLKLGKVINWSWIAVFAPLWAPIALIGIITLVIGFLSGAFK